jgi:hypothetical protein
VDLQGGQQQLKVPPFEQFSGLLQAAGLLIAGAIIGSALFLSIYHHHLNIILIANRELQAENEQLTQDNNSYRISKNQQSRINRLEVVVESGETHPLDKLTEQELERRIRNDLNVVKGQKINSFAESPHLYQKLIAQKTYHSVMDKDYIVNVTTMLLTQTELKVWVTAKESKRSPT